MRLSVKALTITGAILWGATMLLAALINLASPSYGADFLRIMSSVYPGYHASRVFGDVLAGTGYGIVDGAVTGFLVAWLYNLFAGRTGQA